MEQRNKKRNEEKLDLLIKEILEFRNKRDWEQFHDPKNLAEAINIESAELLENFLWKDTKQSKQLNKEELQNLKEEIADIFIYLLYISHSFGIDMISEAKKKVKLNAKKYPIKKSKGIAKKYGELK